MYERVAKQHDEEFLDRQNTTLDSHLIFVRFLFGSLQSLDYFILTIHSRPVSSLLSAPLLL